MRSKIRQGLLCASLLAVSLLLGATLAFGADTSPPPKKDTKPSERACTQSEKDFCNDVTKNFDGKPCGDIEYKVVNNICQCLCKDQPGGTTPKKTPRR
jgi:hypothetical protein